MEYDARTPEEYIDMLPEDRKQTVERLRSVIRESLPPGFEEVIQYGMIGYVVPHSIYPKGYHVNPEDPLPFLGVASQKNHVALYHMGIYSYPDVMEWFKDEYPKFVKTKLDMGKSCIRFKNVNTIPYDLIAELCKKITVEDYIDKYEQSLEMKRNI